MLQDRRKQLFGFEGIKPEKNSGGYYAKVTPVPIPNTEVKLCSAHNTWMETSREDRSLPDLYHSSEGNLGTVFFYVEGPIFHTFI